MKVEAVKQKDGWFIPMVDGFEFTGKDRIVMDITILTEKEKDYQVLDQMIGLCESGKTDASVSHDPLEKFIGRFRTGNSDWADNHDELLGAFANDADIIDQVVESAMQTRENNLLRVN